MDTHQPLRHILLWCLVVSLLVVLVALLGSARLAVMSMLEPLALAERQCVGDGPALPGWEACVRTKVERCPLQAAAPNLMLLVFASLASVASFRLLRRVPRVE